MNRPLRIAVASSGLGHVARGVEAWAADLAAALHARGTDVTLYKGGGQPEAVYERRLRCCPRGVVRPGWLPRGGWRVGLGSGYEVEQTTFAGSLIAALRRTRADVLHVQDSRVALLARRAQRLGLTRTAVVLAHGTEERPEFLARFRYLQHLSPWHLEAVRAAGVWRPTWTAIPNFIDPDIFRPGRADALRAELGIPADQFVVLTAAAIKRHHKRVDHLIAEFARLLELRPGLPATLVVAGGHEAETDAVIASGRQQLGDRVRFLVRFPRSRMPELYRAADAFALCSLFEMMPVAVLEAAASGLPCLTHRHPILEWMVGPGGRAVDMAAPGELAAALAGLADDRAAAARLGAAARSQCVSSFGRDAVVEQITRYHRFAATHPSPPRAAGQGRLPFAVIKDGV